MSDAVTDNAVTDKVIEKIAGMKGISSDAITLDSTFQDLKMDSLDGLDLMFELEEAFDLTIPDDRARSLRNVGNIVEEIQKLISEQASATPPVQS
jgi:acyl carrier protein